MPPITIVTHESPLIRRTMQCDGVYMHSRVNLTLVELDDPPTHPTHSSLARAAAVTQVAHRKT